MTKKTKYYKTDILFWAYISPEKRGSFEDYICHLSRACLKSGLKIKFVLGGKITQSVLSQFLKVKVDYHLLSENDITSNWHMFKIMRAAMPGILNLHFMGYHYMMNTVYHMMGSKIIVTNRSSKARANYSGFNKLELLKKYKRKFCSRSVDHFVSVSNFVAERISSDLAIPDKKVTTIYNGVNIERFRPLRDQMEKSYLRSKYLQKDNDTFVVTFVGQLIEEKGIYILLDTMQSLIKKNDDMILVIVGAGILEDHVRRCIKHTYNNKIMFLGQRDDVDVILRISDLVVVPSIWEEAFGFVIAEASACGIPVIGSRVGGIPEVIIDGKTGILTEPGDINELKKAIELLYNDKELHKRISSAGCEHVRKNFNMHNMVDQTITLYQGYIGTEGKSIC